MVLWEDTTIVGWGETSLGLDSEPYWPSWIPRPEMARFEAKTADAASQYLVRIHLWESQIVAQTKG